MHFNFINCLRKSDLDLWNVSGAMSNNIFDNYVVSVLLILFFT